MAAAAVLSCKVQPERWIAPHLAVRWSCRFTQLVQRTHLWLASWLPAIDKSRGSKSVEVQRVWKVHDERLQFVSLQNAQWLTESLDADDVSHAWIVWCGAAETALADGYRFCGVLSLAGVWFLGVVVALFRVVWLGGHKVRKVRDNFLMLLMVLVFSCIVTLPLPFCFKAVLGVLDAMIRY